MNFTKVKIVVNVPLEATEKVRQALGQAGAGIIGEYSFCSFAVTGQGYYLPSDKAKPYIGQPGKLEAIEEQRIEVTCQRDKANAAIKAMKSAHPYQEVAYDIYPLLDETDL